MCTVVFDNKCGNLFGRTLDLEYSLGEEVVICPRRFPQKLIHVGEFDRKYALMGTACVRDGIPLFYDCVNEAGVAAAALNFPISAKYSDFKKEKLNLASFELMPYLLGSCAGIDEVRNVLSGVNITADAFSKELAPSPLHWMFADKSGSIVVEATKFGLEIHENPVGVMTNEPKFEYQLIRLADHMGLDAFSPDNHLTPAFEPCRYSRGLGCFGLPGDFSSTSRFVRATFVKNHISADGTDKVGRFFHILNSVSVPRGCVMTDEGREVETVYSSCIDLDTLTYYYTTYSSSEIRSVNIGEAELCGGALVRNLMNHVS